MLNLNLRYKYDLKVHFLLLFKSLNCFDSGMFLINTSAHICSNILVSKPYEFGANNANLFEHLYENEISSMLT